MDNFANKNRGERNKSELLSKSKLFQKCILFFTVSSIINNIQEGSRQETLQANQDVLDLTPS